VARHYDFAIDLDVVPPARVNAVKLKIDVPDVGALACQAVAVSLEDLPQRNVGEILERLNNRPTSLVLRMEGDRKLVHSASIRATLMAVKRPRRYTRPATILL
jgi:hypothetical protein